MKTVECTFKRYGKGGYARVTLDIDFESTEFCFSVQLNDDEWNDQLKKGNFNSWFEGVESGVKYALKTLGSTKAKVVLRKIVGLIVDTNYMNIAVASANAVWEAYGFKPSEEMINCMNTLVLKSWDDSSVKLI
jgi:hypothetical protein